MSRLIILDRSVWNRSSGMTSELSDSIPLQPFHDLFCRIKAFTNAGENPGVMLDLHYLAVGLQKQLCCGVGGSPVPALEGVSLRQTNQETGGLCECVAVERPYLSNDRVQLCPTRDPVRVSFLALISFRTLLLISTNCCALTYSNLINRTRETPTRSLFCVRLEP